MGRIPVERDGRDLQERVVEINRVAKVVQGGRRFSFTALVVVGDETENVGVGYGKAREVPLAIAKAVDDAKKNLFRVPKHQNTITHEVTGVYGAGKVLLKPASPGTGVIAGAGVRAVLELAGIRDILAKSLGSANPINLVRATETGLRITVCHLPPATSKWNKIEHRLFSYVSINWRGKPFTSFETVIELISHTTTKQGLTVTAVKDTNCYPTGIKVSDEDLASLSIVRDPFHGDWNYTIQPQELVPLFP